MRTLKLTLLPLSALSTPAQRRQMAVDLASPIDPTRFFEYEPRPPEQRLHSALTELFGLAKHSEEATDAVTGLSCLLAGPLLHRENPPFQLRDLPWDTAGFNNFDKHAAMAPAHTWCPWHKLIYVRFAGCDLLRLAYDFREIGRSVVDGLELVAALERYRIHLFTQYAAVLRAIGYSRLDALWDNGLACDICHRCDTWLEDDA